MMANDTRFTILTEDYSGKNLTHYDVPWMIANIPPSKEGGTTTTANVTMVRGFKRAWVACPPMPRALPFESVGVYPNYWIFSLPLRYASSIGLLLILCDASVKYRRY